MVVKDWKIRIQSDGRPAITFPKGRQDGVLLPEAEDIELSDEGLIFSISRRGKITRYECPFNELGYTAPPTPIAQLQAMRCVTTVPQGHILIFLYEFICGVLTEATPLFFVKHFSLKKASKFPVFSTGISLLLAGTFMHPCA